MEKSIFEFMNTEHNYCRGKYHFVASSEKMAITMAKRFQDIHNRENNMNYRLAFDFKDVKQIPIRDGFLNIR